jgi:hypothetical protein
VSWAWCWWHRAPTSWWPSPVERINPAHKAPGRLPKPVPQAAASPPFPPASSLSYWPSPSVTKMKNNHDVPWSHRLLLWFQGCVDRPTTLLISSPTCSNAYQSQIEEENNWISHIKIVDGVEENLVS